MTIRGLNRPRPICTAKVLPPGDVLRLHFNHWPPTDNGLRRFTGGRTFPNPAVLRFKDLVRCAVIEYRIPTLAGWRVLVFDHVFPHLRHGDPSNYFKVTQDALQAAGILEDDRYALAEVGSAHYPWDPPRDGVTPWQVGMTVTIWPAPPDRVGTPRPANWKQEPWVNPAPANLR